MTWAQWRSPHALTALVLWLALSPALTGAQIVRDNSLGAMKNQPLAGPNYAITPDLGEIKGSNLFHSFSQFNVNTIGSTVESATFTGPAAIGNILTRVSGTTISSINGLINSQIQGANLYFFNPNGVIFGPNASLNVSGAVAFSTANYVRFVDGAKFFASLSQTSTLTSTSIAAFGFLGPTAAPISFQGTILEIPEGQTLSIIGGDISMSGGTVIIAPSGRVNVASAASAGEVVFSTSPGAPPIEMQGFTAQGQISITQGSGIDASGASGPGRATIRGGRVIVNGSFVSSDNLGDEHAAGLGVDIAAVELISLTNGAAVTAAVGGAGHSGGIAMIAAHLDVGNGSLILASTFAAGDAGSITVDATQRVSLHRDGAPGSSTGLFSDALGSGNAGSLLVTTPTLEANGGRIRALTAGSGNGGSISLIVDRLTLTGGVRVDAGAVGGSSGQAGSVMVTAKEGVTVSGAGSGLFSDTSGQGGGAQISVTTPSLAVDQGRISAFTARSADAGHIELDVGLLALTGGGQIIADAVIGSSGRAGTLAVTARQKVSMTGRDAGGNLSGLFASTAGSKGGGQVVIDAPVVEVDGGTIQTGTVAAGNAGTVQVNAGRVSVTNSGQISSSAGAGSSGQAGHLTIIAQTLEVEGGSIQARRDGAGGGGTIDLNVDTITLRGGGRIDAGTSMGKAADAGAISIFGADVVTIAGLDSAGNTSGIFGDAEPNSVGDGSRISVSADTLEMQDGRIQSPTRGAGSGGQITIDGRQLTLLNGAEITSSTAGAAPGGPVTVTASEEILVSGFRTDTSGTIFRSAISSDVLQGSTGAGGQLDISAPLIRLQDNGKIEAATAGSGPGGEIAINTGQLAVSGGGEISVGTLGAGAAGKLTVNATQSVSISGSGALGSSGLFAPATPTSQGDAGSIVINTQTFSMDGGQVQARTSGTGRGGTLLLTANQVSLTGGGQISTSTFGPGPGGTVSISAGSSATFTGSGSGLFSSASGLGAGGDISLKAGAVQLANGGTITAAGSGGGNAGQISIAADSVFQSTNSTVSTAANQGSGGDVTITAGQTLTLSGAAISAQSTGPGNAGDILLSSGNTIAMLSSTVVTEAKAASGGNITLQAPYLIHLINSTVSSSVQGGVQTVGGNITIDPQFLILQNSRIIAQAFQGQGGNILINAGVFLADSTSLVDASSQVGVSGTVTVNSPIQNLSATLAQLTQKYLAAAGLLRERCTVRAKSSLISSFLIKGRDGLPPEPGGVLPSPPGPLPPAQGAAGQSKNKGPGDHLPEFPACG